MKIFFSILILSLLYLAVNPQLHSQFSNPGSITWERTYENQYTNLINWDGGWDVCDADSGNFYIAGHTIIHGGTGGYRIWVLKINPYGDTIWTRILNNIDALAFACASSLNDGGCILTGDGSSPFTIKLDRNGNIIWNKSYPGYFTQSYNIINTTDGGYAACGRTNYDSAIVFKIDSLGDLQWMKKFGSGYIKRFRDLKEIDNGFIIVGTTNESFQSGREPIMIKINNSGLLIWERRYGDFYKVFPYSINNLNDKQYLIGGGIRDSTDTKSQEFIMRTDTSGNIIFAKEIYSDYSVRFTDIGIINNNKYVTSGYKVSGYLFHGKGSLIDSLGNILSEKDFPTPGFMELRSVLSIPNGDIIFAGVAEFSCPTDCERVYAVRTDSTLNYIPISVTPISSSVPEEFKLYQNYPNPFNPSTKIKFDVVSQSFIKIKIFDLIGREIRTLVNEKLSAGTYEIEFSADDLSSGIYFYQLETNKNVIQTRKMILIR